MRPYSRLILLVLAAIFGARMAAADPTGSYLYLTPFGGYTLFDGKYRIMGSTLADKYYAGGRLGYQAKDWVGLELAGGWTPSQLENPVGPDVSFTHGSLDLKFSPFRGRYGGPFVLLGGGARRLKV